MIDKKKLIDFLNSRISLSTEDSIIKLYIEKGDFDMEKPTNNDWRTLNDAMPAIGRIIKIKTKDGEERARLLCNSKDSSMHFFGIPRLKYIDTFSIIGWRHLPPEIRPDFGKLNIGDMVIFYTFCDIEKIEYKHCAVITEKTDNKSIGFSFRADNNPSMWVDERNIKKIIRINLETKKLEET